MDTLLADDPLQILRFHGPAVGTLPARGPALAYIGRMTTIRWCSGVSALLLLLALAACIDGPEPDIQAEYAPSPRGVDDQVPPEQEAFWARLLEHCGNAYSGEVADATPYYEGVGEADRVVAHFLDCSGDRIHIPLHLDDDHSRNWILTRAEGTIRLKHDHRHEDGTEEEISQYGGDAPVPGLGHRQIFPADAHTARILPERADNFWFMDFMDEETFAYGVHWPLHGHSIRIEFDLTDPVEIPPDPWGY